MSATGGTPAFALAPLQLPPVGLAANALQIVGLAITALLVAALAAITYRWYARMRIPEGLAVLAGLAAVAIYLNTDAALGQVIGKDLGLLDLEVALQNTVTFLVAAVAAVVGRRAGDRFAAQLNVVSGAREVDVELSRLVRTVGRVISVTLPESAGQIDDVEGYDPVSDETKAALAGKTLVFPRGLTVAALRERLVDRLQDDYDVGHVDVDLAADGSVEYLAVGSRAAGIGPTLVPGTAATAIRADPPYSATSGDAVQVWTVGGGVEEAGGDAAGAGGNDGETTTVEGADDVAPERVATGELRAAAEDVVTIALDEVDAESIDPTRRYRLATLPSEPRADREFASLLRRADETMGVVTIPEGSPLVGATVGDVAVSVVAIQPAGGTVEAIPSQDRALAAGDVLYPIARPEALRRLENEAAPAEATAEAEGEDDGDDDAEPPEAEPS